MDHDSWCRESTPPVPAPRIRGPVPVPGPAPFFLLIVLIAVPPEPVPPNVTTIYDTLPPAHVSHNRSIRTSKRGRLNTRIAKELEP